MNFYRPLQTPFITEEGDSTYTYHEYRSNLLLRPYVACFWTLEYQASMTGKVHRILPDGCVDIIFDLTASTVSNASFVTGLMNQFETLHLTRNHSFFGIRFYAHTPMSLLRYPIQELMNNQVYLEDLWGNDALLYTEEILAARSTEQRITIAETKLKTMLLVERKYTRTSLLQEGLFYIHEGNGLYSTQSLSQKLHYSERSVRRIFQQELGMSPKEFSRIIRFQNVLNELHHSSCPYMEIALKNGYYDQSHFINDFKRLYGLLPSQVFLSRP